MKNQLLTKQAAITWPVTEYTKIEQHLSHICTGVIASHYLDRKVMWQYIREIYKNDDATDKYPQQQGIVLFLSFTTLYID